MKYKKSIEEISKSSGSDTITCVTMGPAKWRVRVSGELRFMTSYFES